MFSFFANIFGYVLKLLYVIVGNYGWAIILFSILVKGLMIPISLKQQKSIKKNQQIQDEMKQIQFKYKNDPEKLNQETMALYKREGMSPFSGCLSGILQIVLLLSVFLLVRQPLTYMVKMDSEDIKKVEAIVLKDEKQENKSAYSEIAIIQNIKKLENNDSVEEMEKSEVKEYIKQANLNMDFLGIDLSQIPKNNLTDFKVLIIPVLYIISSFISIRMSSNMNNKNKTDKKLITDGTEQKDERYNPMDDASKTMMWMMPIMSVSIAAIAPLGLALYWLMNNILMIIERLVFDKILNKEEEAKTNA